MVGESELSVGVESDGSASLVNDEEGPPVIDVLRDLDNLVLSVLLLGHEDGSVSWHLGLNVEWRFPELALWVLEWNLLDLSPSLRWVLVAVPPGEGVHVLKLEVVWSQALLLVVSDEDHVLLGSSLEVDVLLINSSTPLSHSSGLSDVESVGSILVGKSEVSMSIKSDGLGSGVIDEPCSPVVSLLGNLEDSILTVDLLADVKSELTLSGVLEHESLGELWCDLLVLVHVLWELVVTLGVNGLLDSWSVVLSLELSLLDDDNLELLSLGLGKWFPLNWSKGSEVLEGKVEFSSSELGVKSSIVSESLAWLVLVDLGNNVVSGKSD